ncbi:MAG: preprotein translocase subunit SecA [Dehalococcoidia bacterium]|jgi:preprotein translocase subunit SecA
MFKKLLGGLLDSNEKVIKRFDPVVEKINSLESQIQSLSDEQLHSKTDEFRKRLAGGEELDDILPEAFAAVREAARRTIKQRHFDVQLIGGIVLHQGRIAEMKTGEGKTLVATLPTYLNALDINDEWIEKAQELQGADPAGWGFKPYGLYRDEKGVEEWRLIAPSAIDTTAVGMNVPKQVIQVSRGVHVVTVNDYLSKRDSYWMGPIYNALGLSVATIQHESSFVFDPGYESEDKAWPHLRPVKRREAYAADITYGTNNEFGFDYLRDNMVVDLSQCVQRELNYAIVDEVDYILIDEARTPLIISGPAPEASDKYPVFARVAAVIEQGKDYEIEERERAVKLTDEGMSRVEGLLKTEGLLRSPDLYDPSNAMLMYYLESAIKARVLFKRDREYVVRNGQVIIVDEFTGRMMPGRRYSEGLHQAIEAKEGVKVQRENMTMATITFQNYFRMYEKLAGMTGTAITEAEEFHKIYKLDAVVIPTNKPMKREDHPDFIYQNEEAKFRAVTEEIKKLNAEGKPALVGTVSIEKSEHLAEMLMRKGVKHEVLNAKNHEKEAAIVAQAGRVGAVTVATNMAGRGVDIILGGNPEGRETSDWQKEHDKVVELGGLHIIGTERHEARRIDNQLRGRAGRQGDPGDSRFYVSLEDDVVRRFGGDRIKGIMERFKFDEDMPIENAMVSKAIESSQTKIEGYNFDIRKHLVEYDDVVNAHREIIYGERRKILSGSDVKANIISMVTKEIQGVCAVYLPKGAAAAEIDAAAFLKEVGTILPLPSDLNASTIKQMEPAAIEERLLKRIDETYEQREKEFGADKMRLLERLIMLRMIDRAWVEHLTSMEQMRQSAGLEAMGQRDPLVIYKQRGHTTFEAMTAGIEHDVATTIFRVKIEEKPGQSKMMQSPMAQAAKRPEKAAADKGTPGRNDPCPCGSGKKYKKCCGK